MRTERIVYTPEVILSSRKKDNDRTSSIIKISAKSATLLTAALLALAANAKADVIDIKRVAYEQAQKEYARLKQYDTDGDDFLDDSEQKIMNSDSSDNTKTNTIKNVEIKNSEVKNNETNKDKIKLAQKLLNLLNGYNEDGSKPQKTFWNTNERRNHNHALSFIINNLELKDLIELNQISNNLIINNLQDTEDIALIPINRALIKYRLKNLPNNFTPMQNFEKKSGLFREIIDEGIFSDRATGNFEFNYHNDFTQKVNYICQSPELKELYANNFVFCLNNIEYADYKINQDLYFAKAINKLLFPTNKTDIK